LQKVLNKNAKKILGYLYLANIFLPGATPRKYLYASFGKRII
tara:strand:- start:379 stop:504 length:126 start_codon:yes stop_codon:yes gene_type:complete